MRCAAWETRFRGTGQKKKKKKKTPTETFESALETRGLHFRRAFLFAAEKHGGAGPQTGYDSIHCASDGRGFARARGWRR